MNNPVRISVEEFDLVIFDLDGVVTSTAKVHAAAWKQMFDDYLKKRIRSAENFQPFDIERDYRRYVDGKPRYAGVQSFLKSRSITLDYGSPKNSPDQETICGLGNRKNQIFHVLLKEKGVEVYDSTVDLIYILKAHGIKTAVVSSSKNCSTVLEAAGITDLFDVQVDGVLSDLLGLEGKPAPDIFLEAARRLQVDPGRAVVVEDAQAGVAAGRSGNFGCVIGVDRVGQREALMKSGADAVVSDLGEIAVGDTLTSGPTTDVLPTALDRFDEILERMEGKQVAVFLDYDGTLTPIVRVPEQSVLSAQMKEVVKTLAHRCLVAIVSGRDLIDVRERVGLEDAFYAGSHGFDIAGPRDFHFQYQQGTDYLPVLDSAEQEMRNCLDDVPGIQVERKRFSLAVHYRNVPDQRVPGVKAVFEQVAEEHPGLKPSSGKKVLELMPDIDWNKGKAILWLLKVLDLDQSNVLPFYIGDDTTDEDGFCALQDRGIGIVVEEGSRKTAAQYVLHNPENVRHFLSALAAVLEGGEE